MVDYLLPHSVDNKVLVGVASSERHLNFLQVKASSCLELMELSC